MTKTVMEAGNQVRLSLSLLTPSIDGIIGMSQTDGPRRGSSGSVLTTPSRILDSVDHEDDDRTIS